MSFQKSKWISRNQINLRKPNDLPYIEDEGENTYRAHLSTEGEGEKHAKGTSLN
jgi:hypothetical protein